MLPVECSLLYVLQHVLQILPPISPCQHAFCHKYVRVRAKVVVFLYLNKFLEIWSKPILNFVLWSSSV